MENLNEPLSLKTLINILGGGTAIAIALVLVVLLILNVFI